MGIVVGGLLYHEAIIDPKIFEQVQAEMVRRKNNNGRYSGVGTFASKIKCGECGNWYGSKVWHSNDKYKGRIFQCNHKYKGDKVCMTPHLTENEVKEIFVKAVNQYLTEKSVLLTNADEICRIAGDTASLEARCDTLTAEMNASAGYGNWTHSSPSSIRDCGATRSSI